MFIRAFQKTKSFLRSERPAPPKRRSLLTSNRVTRPPQPRQVLTMVILPWIRVELDRGLQLTVKFGETFRPVGMAITLSCPLRTVMQAYSSGDCRALNIFRGWMPTLALSTMRIRGSYG